MAVVSSFLNNSPQTIEVDTRIIAGLILLLIIAGLITMLTLIPRIASATHQFFFSQPTSTVYQKIFSPLLKKRLFGKSLSIVRKKSLALIRGVQRLHLNRLKERECKLRKPKLASLF